MVKILSNTRLITFWLYLLAIPIFFLGTSEVEYQLPFPAVSALLRYGIIIATLFLLFLFVITQSAKLEYKRILIINVFFILILILLFNLLINNDAVTDEILSRNVRFILALLASTMIYIIFQQKIIKNIYHAILSYQKIIFATICLLTVITFVKSFGLVNDYFGIKDLLAIPVGKSNFIASWILMLTTYLCFISKNGTFTVITFTAGLLSMLCTRTRVGIISYALLLLILLYHNRKTIHIQHIKPFITLVIILLGGIYFLQGVDLESFFSRTVVTFQAIFTESDFDFAFNGRLELYHIAMDNFLQNPLTGTGMGELPHNYILELLANVGLLGLFSVIFQYIRECKIVCVNRYCMNLLYAPYWGKQR